MQRAHRAHRQSGEPRAQALDTGPAVDSVDQVALYRMGRRVDQLVNHRIAVGQLDDAGLLG
jgi:hypothetical protein